MNRISDPPARTTLRRMDEIIDAAAAVFARAGYHGASTQDIADRLGIRQASLYYYVRSKEAALEAVCVIGVEGYVERAREIAQSNLSNGEKLARLIRAHLWPMHDRADYVRVFLSQRQHLPAPSRRRIGARSRAYEQVCKGVIEAGVSQGVFRADLNPAQMTMALIGACNAATAWPGVVPGMDLAQSIRVVTAMMSRALAADKLPGATD